MEPCCFALKDVGWFTFFATYNENTLKNPPTPTCSSLNSSVIRMYRVMKFHYRAFLSNLVNQRVLELSNLIDQSDFRGLRSILT